MKQILIITITVLLFLLNTNSVYSQIDYSEFDTLLHKYVKGNSVKYSQLIEEKDRLLLFTEKLSEVSPKSHPLYFKSENEQLAYWINAYNAFILKIIVENYPVESINEINILEIQPVSFLIKFDSLESKMVAVRPDIELDFEQQYNIISAIKIIPERVLVKGPGTILDTLNSIYTEKKQFSRVKKSIQETLQLAVPENIIQFVGNIAGVKGHHDRAELENAEEHGNELGIAGLDCCHAVAFADAHLDESVGDTVGIFFQFVEGDPLFAHKDSCLAAKSFYRVLQ